MGTRLLAVLTALLAIGCVATRIHAAPLLSLGLQQDGVNGGVITTVATDASSPGSLSFMGVYGSFTLGDTGATGSASQSPILNTQVLVSSNSGGLLRVYMTQQDLNSPQGVNPLSSSLCVNELTGAVAVTMSTLVSASNSLYVGNVLAPPMTFSTTRCDASTHDTPDLSGLYSRTVVYEIALNGQGSTFSAASMSPPLGSPVPEPVSLTLFGIGFAGLVLVRLRASA